MDLHMYTILIAMGMVFFILSFFVKDKEDRFMVTTMSCLHGFVAAASSFYVELTTNDGVTVWISEYYAMPLTFFFLSVVQFLRLFYVSYEKLDGEYK